MATIKIEASGMSMSLEVTDHAATELATEIINKRLVDTFLAVEGLGEPHKKIQAIKEIRSVTDLGLKNAKAVIDGDRILSADELPSGVKMEDVRDKLESYGVRFRQ